MPEFSRTPEVQSSCPPGKSGPTSQARPKSFCAGPWPFRRREIGRSAEQFRAGAGADGVQRGLRRLTAGRAPFPFGTVVSPMLLLDGRSPKGAWAKVRPTSLRSSSAGKAGNGNSFLVRANGRGHSPLDRLDAPFSRIVPGGRRRIVGGYLEGRRLSIPKVQRVAAISSLAMAFAIASMRVAFAWWGRPPDTVLGAISDGRAGFSANAPAARRRAGARRGHRYSGVHRGQHACPSRGLEGALGGVRPGNQPATLAVGLDGMLRCPVVDKQN